MTRSSIFASLPRVAGLAVAVAATLAARPASAQLGSTATASPTTLTQGNPLTVDALVTNTAAAVTAGHIQIFLRNRATNASQAAQNCDVTIAGGGAGTSCHQVFTALPVGSYSVELGVFDAGWSNLSWNSSAALPVVTVSAGSGFTSSATVSATTIPTTGSVTVSARIVNQGGDVTAGHVQIFLRNLGTNAGQTSQTCDGDIRGAGAATTCNRTFSALPAGSYGVELGVFTSSWSNLSWSAGPPLPTVTVVAGSADVTIAVDTSRNRRAISPLVYGSNDLAPVPPGATLLRGGGNRWTAYNWTNNFSNAGADFGPYSNDTNMGSPASGPGAAPATIIRDAQATGAAALVTIPIQGWVSKDASGNVSLTSPLTDRFVPNQPRKGSAFTTAPSPTSTTVFQDELAHFVAVTLGSGRTPHLSLDNEPDLWRNPTHPEVQRSALSYAALLSQTVASASAIRDAVPGALIYGPVSFGWSGYVNLQGAPDAPSNASIDNSFLDAYLQRMNSESAGRGVRLLDVLDIHYYTEATGCGTRVNNPGAGNSDCVVAARVQAPRSLADPTFVETSWITQTTPGSSFGTAIQLVPRMLAKIAARFAGTRLGITEYDFGGTDHVSGALAEADALGLMGREGVYAAAWWRQGSPSGAWVPAAWRAYRNYDGAGHNFGDTAVLASSSDLDHVSVFASVDAASAGRVVLVVIHRPTLAGSSLDLRARTVQIQLTHSQTLATARAWQLTAGATPTSAWPAVAVARPQGNALTLTLPPESITTIELTP